jgi:predicted membrane protein
MSSTFSKPRIVAFNPERLVIGGSLVAFGVLVFLQQAGYAVAGAIIAGWWPLVIVALGLAHLPGSRPGSVGALFTMLIGLALLAGTLEIIPGGTLALVWPLVLIWAGLSLLVHRAGKASTTASDENHLNLSVSWGGISHVSHAQRFQDANLSALCGGIVLDLRGATLDPDGATIHASATCGGIEIRVPTGWRVEVSGTPVFGAHETKALEGELPAPDAPHLRIEAAAVFGGVEVKH